MKLPTNYVPGEGVRKATAFGGKGQRMLEKMGWRQGQGLGPAKDGMREALETKEKKDTAGVGANQGFDWSTKFWEDSYNAMAGKIQHDHAQASSSSDSSSSDDSDGDDAATAVANKRRRSSGAAASTSSSDSDSDASPGAIKAAATARARKSASPGLKQDGAGGRAERAGRAGKLARVAQHEAAEAARLAALLDGGKGGGDRKEGGKKDEAEAAGKGSERQRSEGAGKDGGQGKKQRIVVTLSIPDDPCIKPMAFKPTPLTGWWGAGYFRSAGAMGGVEEKAKAEEAKEEEESRIRVSGFREQDQAALYMQAHLNQRRGHTGLGQSTRSLKIEGGNWEGSRKTFDEDGEAAEGNREEQGVGVQASGEGEDGEGAKKKEKKKSKKEKRQNGAAESAVVENGDAEEGGERRKGGKKKRRQQESGEQNGGGPCTQTEGAGAEDNSGQATSSKKRRKGEKGEEPSTANGKTTLTPKNALKLARALVQQAPNGRMQVSKLCKRLTKHHGGSQEDLSSLLHKKAKKGKVAIEDGYVLLPAS